MQLTHNEQSTFRDTINLLIVDDNIHNVAALETSLEQDNVKIFTATSPKNVIQICTDNDISIALIDIKMPEIDGFELLDIIKKNPVTEHIMVILITGYSMSAEHVVKGLSKGAVDYLFKPLDLYITIAKVNSLITLVNYQREINLKNTELERYQKELIEAIENIEKSKIIKENFLANMSHEIRTPLNAIIGISYLLHDTPVNAEQQEMIELMSFSSKSLLGIVNDILESAQLDAGKIKIVRAKVNILNLVKTIAGLTEPLAAEKGLNLICEIDPEVPSTIMADSLRLNQILTNLINNAIKFTHAGNVTIKLDLLEKSEGQVHLAFVIKDSGVGIPQSSIEKIFTRFEQIEDKTWQKFGGNGLGLSIVKRLVALKGGVLKVDSVVGSGTTFTFSNWYTAHQEIAYADSLTHKISSLPKFDNILVLLAEDNSATQYVVVKMLKEWNIKVDVAKNGLEAIEKIKEHQYNLVLMDTHMPVMNGIESTKIIRSELSGAKKNIPIISLSASVVSWEKEEAKNAGVNDFVEKPFDPEVLHAKIQNILINTNAGNGNDGE